MTRMRSAIRLKQGSTSFGLVILLVLPRGRFSQRSSWKGVPASVRVVVLFFLVVRFGAFANEHVWYDSFGTTLLVAVFHNNYLYITVKLNNIAVKYYPNKSIHIILPPRALQPSNSNTLRTFYTNTLIYPSRHRCNTQPQ